MQQQFNAFNGQSLLDVCLNTYGSLDYLLKLVQDNGIANVNVVPVSGQAFVYDDSLVIDQSTLQQTTAAGIIYCTGQSVSFRIGDKGDYNADYSSDFNMY